MRRQVFLPNLQENPYFCFPEAVGWYQKEPLHYAYREKDTFPFFNLHVVLSGKGYIKCNSEVHMLQQGDAFLYFPYEEQEYYSDKENPWEVVWVHFNGRYLKEYFLEKAYQLSNVWTLKFFGNLREMIISLLEETEENVMLQQSKLSMLTYGVIAEFITQAEPLTTNKSVDIYYRILDILPKMREDSGKAFSLHQWAEQVGISSFYFCKMFKKATGVTPNKFITLCRLQKAKQLLIEHSDWTVKRIALECGYPSISYFGRLFLENEGQTPASYRRQFFHNKNHE